MVVTVSVAVSIDGYIADTSPERLHLSSAEDLTDMYRARAEHDAILVGAETVRRDNPALLLKEPLPPAHPARVTLTRSGALSSELRFFNGEARSIVLAPAATAAALEQRLNGKAEVAVLASDEPAAIIRALQALGIRSVFVEGGTRVLTAFLSAGLFNELRLAIAPFFVGQAGAPRIAGPANFFHDQHRRLHLIDTRALGDTAVQRFGNPNIGEICERLGLS
jgi:5-amino-6-(5-phosphoribosylamino)uracil reductase